MTAGAITVPAPERADQRPLTGRSGVLDAVRESWIGSGGRSFVVVGEAGVGRTRMAREILATARDAGRPVRWSVGSRAAAAVPFAALAPLVRGPEPESASLAAWRAAIAASDDDPAGRLVVAVDDAHLLDAHSLTLIHQMVVTRSACLVLTVRVDLAVPEAIAALWKDGWAERLDLEPLNREETDDLASATLGALLDAQTSEKLWRATRGRPLFLRELIEGARAGGDLAVRNGLWHWDGPVLPTRRLRDMVRAQWGAVDAGEQYVLELVAAGEPLALGTLTALADADAVASLERRRLVVVDEPGAPHASARLAHPLHGAVVRAETPTSRALQLHHRLTGAQPGPAQGPDVDERNDAARAANAALDHAEAERLARAAVAADGEHTGARLALLEAVRGQGRHAEASVIERSTAALAGDAEACAALAVARAVGQVFGTGRGEAAIEELAGTARAIGPGAPAQRLEAARALLAFLVKGPVDAVAVAHAVLADADTDATGRAWAAAAATAGLAARGHAQECAAMAATARAAYDEAVMDTDAALVRLVLTHGELLGLWVDGRLDELGAHGYRLYESSTADPGSWADGVSAMFVGWTALAVGRPRTAVRWLGGAVVGLDRGGADGWVRISRALLAYGQALLGDVAGAGDTLRDVGDDGHPSTRMFEPLVLLARSWHAFGEHRHEDAARLAHRAAAVARAYGHATFEVAALHALVRFGGAGEVLDRLRDLAATGGELVTTCLEHAEAAAARDGRRLDEVAQRWENLGAGIRATDAYVQAATCHARDDGHAAARSAARADRVARECEAAGTPAIGRLGAPSLTRREREIATLAARELSNKEIAARLGRSVRTVEAHLASVFAKLGLHRRSEIGQALETRRDS